MSEFGMTRQEREAFLADVHVGVVAIAEPGRAPLAVPVWYAYEPGGQIRFVTGPNSRKGRLLKQAGRASLCVQTETAPYKYVSVEGPTSLGPVDYERDLRAIAHRLPRPEFGDVYLARRRRREAGRHGPGDTDGRSAGTASTTARCPGEESHGSSSSSARGGCRISRRAGVPEVLVREPRARSVKKYAGRRSASAATSRCTRSTIPSRRRSGRAAAGPRPTTASPSSGGTASTSVMGRGAEDPKWQEASLALLEDEKRFIDLANSPLLGRRPERPVVDGDISMKLGLMLGYWMPDPVRSAAAREGGGEPRLRLGVDGRGLRLRTPFTPLAWVGRAHVPHQGWARASCRSRPRRRRASP
jgi:hypothetical protein